MIISEDEIKQFLKAWDEQALTEQEMADKIKIHRVSLARIIRKKHCAKSVYRKMRRFFLASYASNNSNEAES
jgi:hypothetical protein